MFQKSGKLQVYYPTSFLRSVSPRVSHRKTPLAVTLRVMLFSFCAFMHLVVVSQREIAAFVMCVGVFCITMTKSSACPNGCVSNFQVQVKRVKHVRAVNSCFPSRCGRFRVMRVVIRGPLCTFICPLCVHIARWARLCSRTYDAPY